MNISRVNTSKKFTLNTQHIARDTDRALFDPEKMQIYEFNEAGFELLGFFANNQLTFEEWLEKAKSINECASENLERFFNEAISYSILLEC
jgi:hypothetical protein